MALSAWTLTKQYADDTYLTESQLDAGFNSGVTWSQSVVATVNANVTRATAASTKAVTASYNALQITRDVFGATYSLDGDGAKDLTNTLYKDCFGVSWTTDAPKTNSLYNKQSASVRYLAEVSLGTSDVSTPTLVSASLNLRLAPEATGKYLVTMTFPVKFGTTDGANLQDRFMLVQKTSGATLIGTNVGINMDDGAAIHDVPVHLSYIYNFPDTNAATFALYYTSANGNAASISDHRLLGSATFKTGYYAQIHKI